jgi:chromosome partitioning protein
MAPQIHGIANQKGGVGKTTVAMNLAAVAYDALVRPESLFMETAEEVGDPISPILVVSTDPQNSSVWWSRRVEQKHGLPFNFTQARDPEELRALRHTSYEHVLIDTPGSLEDERILTSVLDICDDVLVPLPPAPLAFDPTARTIEQVIKPRGVPFRVVVNDWDPRDGTVDLKQTGTYILKMGWPMCSTVIRRYKIHTRASAEGLVVTQYPKNRVSMEAREDFYKLALELGYGGASAGTPSMFEAVR